MNRLEQICQQLGPNWQTTLADLYPQLTYDQINRIKRGKCNLLGKHEKAITDLVKSYMDSQTRFVDGMFMIPLKGNEWTKSRALPGVSFRLKQEDDRFYLDVFFSDRNE